MASTKYHPIQKRLQLPDGTPHEAVITLNDPHAQGFIILFQHMIIITIIVHYIVTSIAILSAGWRLSLGGFGFKIAVFLLHFAVLCNIY